MSDEFFLISHGHVLDSYDTKEEAEAVAEELICTCIKLGGKQQFVSTVGVVRLVTTVEWWGVPRTRKGGHMSEAVLQGILAYDQQDAELAIYRVELASLDHTWSVVEDITWDINDMIANGWDDKDWAVY